MLGETEKKYGDFQPNKPKPVLIVGLKELTVPKQKNGGRTLMEDLMKKFITIDQFSP